MKLFPTISSFLVLAAVLACAAADDLTVLKTTLQKLCDANKGGTYGSCCASYNNGQDITEIKSMPRCFGSTFSSSGTTIQKLFVSSVWTLA